MTARFPGEPFIVAGDLPDRGPDTRQLIDYVIHNKISCVRGNHDDMMSDPKQREDWLANGGYRALQSYCLHPNPYEKHDCEGIKALEEHREFIKSLPYWLEYPELKHENGRHLLVTHAPIRHGHLKNQLLNIHWGMLDFIWNRNKPPRSNVKNWFNVHGHTPRSKGPEITEWYANIDLGCAYVDRDDGYGKLSCLRFPSMEVFIQENIEGDDLNDQLT
jgi:serine/threonine protein phosphatase 1